MDHFLKRRGAAPGAVAVAAGLTLGLAVGLTLPGGPATAQDAPANVDECLQKSFEAASRAKEKGLSEDAMAALEPILVKLEGECDSGNMAAAGATLKELDAKIEGS
ncbi:MAG: hypothetical protein AAFV45_00715 [Pseudomonadota bacterium]